MRTRNGGNAMFDRAVLVGFLATIPILFLGISRETGLEYALIPSLIMLSGIVAVLLNVPKARWTQTLLTPKIVAVALGVASVSFFLYASILIFLLNPPSAPAPWWQPVLGVAKFGAAPCMLWLGSVWILGRLGLDRPKVVAEEKAHPKWHAATKADTPVVRIAMTFAAYAVLMTIVKVGAIIDPIKPPTGMSSRLEDIRPITQDALKLGVSSGGDSPIVVAVFSDFTCPACASTTPTLAARAARTRGKVQLVFFPTFSRQREHSLLGVMAFLAAEKQGKPWEAFDYLFQGSDPIPIKVASLPRRLGLDSGRFTHDIESVEVKREAEIIRALAINSGVTGLPTSALIQPNKPQVFLPHEALMAELDRIAP